MKVIIAGSRDIGYNGSEIKKDDYDLLCDTILKSKFEITEVVSGMANGVDTLGTYWAKENNIPFVSFYPEWDIYKKLAGLKRNEQMGDYADALIYLHDGESTGTLHMINYAKQKGLKVFGYNTKTQKWTEGEIDVAIQN